MFRLLLDITIRPIVQILKLEMFKRSSTRITQNLTSSRNGWLSRKIFHAGLPSVNWRIWAAAHFQMCIRALFRYEICMNNIICCFVGRKQNNFEQTSRFSSCNQKIMAGSFAWGSTNFDASCSSSSQHHRVTLLLRLCASDHEEDRVDVDSRTNADNNSARAGEADRPKAYHARSLHQAFHLSNAQWTRLHGTKKHSASGHQAGESARRHGDGSFENCWFWKVYLFILRAHFFGDFQFETLSAGHVEFRVSSHTILSSTGIMHAISSIWTNNW